MVNRGWDCHVKGLGRAFPSARTAVETYRTENPRLIDQDMHEFVIVDAKGPVGTINDGDSVVYFNFRGDRALEITSAFEDDGFEKFDRGVRPSVYYAGMMQYDGDPGVPKHFLVTPPAIDRTLVSTSPPPMSGRWPSPKRRNSAMSPIFLMGTEQVNSPKSWKTISKSPATAYPLNSGPG